MGWPFFARVVPNTRAEGRAHDSASAEPGKVAYLTAPEGTVAAYVSIETAPIRVTIDGNDPTPEYGLLLRRGDHGAFGIAASTTFAFRPAEGETGGDRTARVSVVWLAEEEPPPTGA